MTTADVAITSQASGTRRIGEPWVLAGLLTAPCLYIIIMAVVPAFLMVQLSLAHREVGGLWSPGFELTQYRQLATPLFARVMGFSLLLAVAGAAICVSLAFPAAYFITRMKRRAQVAWLVFLLGSLSLSEVLIVFAFQVLLSTSGTLAGALSAVGLLAPGASLYPNFPAVLTCLVYLLLPYVILYFYPALSQLDPEVEQAAATMGASRFSTFTSVVLPMMRGQILTGVLLVVIFTFGAYLTPLVLGRPPQWTIAIHISNAAMGAGNVPLAAAYAVAVVVFMVALLALTRLLSRRRGAEA
ncbi:MAG: ABC transporter permease [Phenylobacterium sp.]|nr:ABC transporter permease [Phenylobacterium sp.]